MNAPHRCGNCPARWWGARIAHCSSCHETFSTVTAFDAHRVGPDNARRCDTAAADRNGLPKLRQTDAGTWVMGEALPVDFQVTRGGGN